MNALRTNVKLVSADREIGHPVKLRFEGSEPSVVIELNTRRFTDAEIADMVGKDFYLDLTVCVSR